MRISIITPSYNQADFIEHTIRSVLGQNYPDLEYIIIDGGSTDGSVDIIKRYAERLAWWISEPDKGQADAINKGFRKATGDVVAWLNSDDMYAPGIFDEVIREFQSDPEIGMVYGNAVSFDREGYPLNDLGIGNWGLEDLAAFQIVCQPAAFIRKSVLEQVGYLDDHYHMMLDHHLWLRIAQQKAIKHVPTLWAFARYHAEAKNVSQAPKFGQEAFRIWEWMQSQPDLVEIINENNQMILARLHRFNGRYLLDGRDYQAALIAYVHSMRYKPSVAFQEWHRILYALLGMLGFRDLGKLYYNFKKRRIPASIKAMDIENIHDIYSENYQK